MTIYFAGGGTAGHIYAGIALADRYRAADPATRIQFVGARGGMEERLVPRAGYALRLVSIGSWNGASPAKKLKTLLQIPWSFLQSAVWLLRDRPEIVLGVGGYASFPLVLAAALLGPLWGARVAILEQNVLPGLTNRILGRLAGRVFAAFPGCETAFTAGRVQVTGNPIRGAITRLQPARREPFTIFVFGGSQGAMGINSLVIQSLPHLGPESGVRVRWIHQTGEKDYDRVAAAHQKAGSDARVEKFIYDMPAAYGEASLLICRAGSSTLSEVATVGRAAVLIPLVSNDRHQEFNAGHFSSAGAARMLRQQESDGLRLAELVLELARNPDRIEAMERKVVEFARPDAVDRIVGALGGIPE